VLGEESRARHFLDGLLCVFVGEGAEVMVVRAGRARELRVARDGPRSSCKHLSSVVVMVVDGGRVAEWRHVLCLNPRLSSVQRPSQTKIERCVGRGGDAV
jgi:hypothetical protein